MAVKIDPLESLRQRWAAGERPDLTAILADAGPLSPAQVAELVRLDQRQRWEAGVPVSAEDLLQRFPVLNADPDLAVDIIFNEYLLREKLGQAPQADEYVRRFPAHAGVLRDQVNLHGALATRDTTDQQTEVGPSGHWPTPTFVRLDSAARSRDQYDGALPENFGRYRLLKTLGQGGMGTVYLAHDTQLMRQVALKAPRFASAEGIERFQREARIAAAFHHPNLCPVYDVGEIDGVTYFTMPFLAGEALSCLLKRSGPLPPPQAATLAAQTARAMQVAHDAGVRHRDLKPANIMIQDGSRPIVMDFGLARHGGQDDPRLTAAGHVVGTAAYMPPERIAGDPDDLEPAGDVYSLGVILFEMLTGRLPFQGTGREILRAALAADPPSPRQFRAGLDPALEAVCLKALAKDPADRYATMNDMAAALEQTIPSQAGGQSGAAASQCKAKFLAPVAVVAALLLGGWLWSLLSSSTPHDGPGGEKPGVPDKKPTDPAIKATPAWEEKTSLLGHDATVTALAFGPKGRLLASASEDGNVRLWDVVAGKGNASWKEGKGVTLSVAFSPGGGRVASAGGDEPNLNWDILLWNVDAGRVDARLKGHFYLVSALAFSPDGASLASAAGDNTVRLWDIAKGEQRALLEGHTIWVRSVAYSKKGGLLASGADDETVRLWDAGTGKSRGVLKGHERAVLCVALSPDGSLAASASADGTVRLWDAAAARCLGILAAHKGGATSVAFSPDGKRLVSGGADRLVRVWSVAGEKPLRTLEGHKGEVRAVAFSDDGRTIASGGVDRSVMLWTAPE